MAFDDDPLVRPDDWFSTNLPRLRERECRLTSKCTFDYNCVGYVAGDFLWWHPEERQEHYWPDGLKRDLRLWARDYMLALETANYKPLKRRPQFDPAYENIVIYHKGGKFTHVALQVSANRWKSKLGSYEDLEHPEEAMLDGAYGRVFRYMRRDISLGGFSLPDEYRL